MSAFFTLVALQGLRNVGKIKEGHRVMIYGASGGNGTFAVLDYTREGFHLGHELYDLILGCSGFRPIREYKEALRPGGIYVSLGGEMKQFNQGLVLGPLLSERKGKKLIPLLHRPSRDDLIYMSELILTGKVRPVVDRCFSLDQIREALRYYGEGRSRGKVVISINQAPLE
jgi:NADPH:quinone reductase-like Zn-dependent oxidoreductase